MESENIQRTSSDSAQPRTKHGFGRQGEEVAHKFLEDKGWTIVDYNWRAGHKAEIDIVAQDLIGAMVFVEVKTRRTYAEPDYDEEVGFSSIRGIKQHKIIKAGLRYLARNGLTVDDVACRFDVIVVHYRDELSTPEILHVQDAFHELSWSVEADTD